LPREPIVAPGVSAYEQIKTSIFFLGVLFLMAMMGAVGMGELSPPTSLTAAISARIAEASFMRTMWEALRICLPITLMSFAIFSRSEMVVNPGWTQIGAVVVVTIGTCGTALAMFGRLIENKVGDILLRAALMLAAFGALFYPDDKVSAATAAFVLAAIILGVIRHRRVGPGKDLQSLPIG